MLWMAVTMVAIVPVSRAQTVELDPKLTEIIIANTANAHVWEQGRNDNVTQQRKSQDSIMAKTTTLLSIKELALASLDNVDGFGYESGLYKQMCGHCVGIANSSLQLVTRLNDLKVDFVAVMEVGKLVDRAKDLARTFSDIVTNGKVKSPMDNAHGHSDGKNYLKRKDRMGMAFRIVMDLGRIRAQLDSMLNQARYLTLQRVFYMLDRDSWANMWGGKITIDIIKDRWRNFKHH